MAISSRCNCKTTCSIH